ncbi:PP2C family protein-serine/threonine phosphatase [Nocardioides cynanchi]|uniref:PP2C family protein-serine/threonine phosphatase n=1 Tax=Nocardioides cynanchi TaxID=2558918 RepID=UPI001248820E|nr:SpoIIE family protein phosphatase [Nocardioides cynanchi]
MATSEPLRLAALYELGLLDTPPEERFDRVVRLAKRIFDVPMVAVNLIDEDRLFTKSAIGVEAGGSTPRDISFCPRTIETGTSLVVPDARQDPRWARNPLVTGDPGIRFYAGAPLAAPGGELVGALCLIDDEPRDLSPTDHALLEDLARWVEVELAADADALQAREIQKRLLPRHPPVIPGYDIAGRCQPALHVGGDYFDWHLLDDTLLQFTVADVMGKGLAAGVIAAGVRTALRATARFNTLSDAIRLTASSMQDDFDNTGTFATLFTARLRPSQGHLEYVDAGHGLALIVHADGEMEQLSSRDLPLGSDLDTNWQSQESRLAPGDTLMVVSDGLLDIYPEPDDVLEAARKLAASDRTAEQMCDRIMDASIGHEVADDLTALVIRREPSW